MALEAVVFPQEHFACTAAKVAAHSASPPGCGFDIIDELEDKGGVVLQEEVAEAMALHGVGAAATCWDAALRPCSNIARPAGAMLEAERWDRDVHDHHSVSPPPVPPALVRERSKAAAPAASRRRKRRPKAVKNEEEMESQRRNHIAVERNRRRQMNEYLAVLRSVMPPSYAHRGDQASIVAGAINFVKELEQTLQSLEVQKRRAQQGHEPSQPAPPFAGFFTFPQYSTIGVVTGDDASDNNNASFGGGGDHQQCASRRGVADIEVAVAESHANVKVLTPRRPRQLLRMVVAMQCLRLTVLHLNVTTTADNLAFYSFSLKMEDECRLSSVDEIASAVNEIVAKISEEGSACQ